MPAASTPTIVSTPELIYFEQIPDELPDLGDLAVFESHSQAGRVVETLTVALAGSGEQRHGVAIVGDDIGELEMKRAVGQRPDVQEEREDRVAALVCTCQLPLAAREPPHGVLRDRLLDLPNVAALEGGE